MIITSTLPSACSLGAAPGPAEERRTLYLHTPIVMVSLLGLKLRRGETHLQSWRAGFVPVTLDAQR